MVKKVLGKNQGINKGINKGVILIFSFISIIFLINLVVSSDVAYIYKAKPRIDNNILSVFDELNLTYDTINERSMPSNFNDYKLIYVGNERFSKKIPVNDYPSVVTTYYFGQDWGLTDRDGISKLAATHPLEVQKNGQIIQVYTQARYNNKPISLPYFYLGTENVVPGMDQIAGTYMGDSYDLGDVISYAKAGTHLINGKVAKGDICFYGISESSYWTNGARNLFIECVNRVATVCSKDSDCPSETTGDKYCEDNKVYEDVTSYTCINPSTAKSECVSNIEKKLVEECSDMCVDGECVGIICKKDSECGENGFKDKFCKDDDVYGNYFEYTCNEPGTPESSCSNESSERLIEECRGICVNGDCITGIHDVSLIDFSDSIDKIRLETKDGVRILDDPAKLTCNKEYKIYINVKNNGIFTENVTFAGSIGELLFNHNAINDLFPGLDSLEFRLVDITLPEGTYNINIDSIISDDEDLSNNNAKREIIVDCPECSNDSQCPSDYCSDTLKCSGNNVVCENHDFSCINGKCNENIFDKILESCKDNEECFNGECKKIVCSDKSDCGVDGFTGDKYCMNENSYQDNVKYKCNNPGAIDSYCSNTTTKVLLDECSLVCIEGECIDCFNELSCGIDGFIGNKFCKDNSVYQKYEDFSCIFKGTPESKCESVVSDKLIKDCSDICINGECKDIRCKLDIDCNDLNVNTVDKCINPNTISSYCTNTPVNCVNDADCGHTGFLGTEFCYLNDVFKNYQSSICKNPGTVQSYCELSLFPKLIYDCTEICVNATCTGACSDNDLDGFDTCSPGSTGDDGKQIDCNDNNNKIYPGAPEICDGLDNDCDGLVDEGNGDCLTGETCVNKKCEKDCIKEGGTIPVIPNAPVCCNGLTLIPPMSPDVIGISGICTNKCGNNVCDILTESNYNCPVDCKIVCTKDSDCGDDGYVNNALCKNNDVFQDFKDFSCKLPGSLDSECTSSINNILKEDCGDDSCGNYGENFCKSGDVYKSRTCEKRGCNLGSCFENIVNEEVKITECSDGCINGECVDIICDDDSDCDDNDVYTIDKCHNKETIQSYCSNTPVNCLLDADCGITGYIGTEFCMGDDVFKSYQESLCKNPGTTQSFCMLSLTQKLINDCGTDSCEDFSENYCKNNNVYKKRTCYDKGCLNKGCFSNSNIDEVLVDICTGNEVCTNGECKSNPVCFNNPDCGTDGFLGNKYCSLKDVYQAYKTFTCLNPGQSNSDCSYLTKPKYIETCTGACLNGTCIDSCVDNDNDGFDTCNPGNPGDDGKQIDCNDNNNKIYPGAPEICDGLDNDCDGLVDENNGNCGAGKICTNGQCLEIGCEKHSDCGVDTFIGNPYCETGNNVFGNYEIYKCNNPGAVNSFCSSSINPKFVKSCLQNQVCLNGECKNVVCFKDLDCDDLNDYTKDECINPGTSSSYCSYIPINCLKNSDCGIDSFIGNNFCESGNNVFGNYITHACLNPGTISSNCMLSSSVKLKESCSNNKICINGECKDNNCIDNDNDGFDTCNPGNPGDDGKQIDCNDNNNKIYPGASEICDGLDNDCDGLVDEGNGDCLTGETCVNKKCEKDCIKEGGTILVIPNAPVCCNGLTLIPPMSPDVIGISGICTNKCGNNVCDILTESNYNCPVDCKIVCLSDSNCGVDSNIGELFCKNNDSYQKFASYKCNNPGTINSYCTNSTEDRLKNDCLNNQKCVNGICVEEGCVLLKSGIKTFSGKTMPFLDCGNGYCNPGTHWKSKDNGNSPVLVMDNLVAGQFIELSNIQGSVNFGYVSGLGSTASCKYGISDKYNIPKFIGIAQFTDENNKVVAAPSGTGVISIVTGVGQTNAILLRTFVNGVIVPEKAKKLYVSFPDSRYKDNSGTCSFRFSVYDKKCE